MKTETQIAQGKLKGCGEEREFTNDKSYYCGKVDSKGKINYCDDCEKEMRTHKETCQRFLEWLKKHRDCDNSCINLKNLRPKSKKLEEGYKAALKCQVEIYDKKITDLKQAIKLYNEAGIK